MSYIIVYISLQYIYIIVYIFLYNIYIYNCIYISLQYIYIIVYIYFSTIYIYNFHSQIKCIVNYSKLNAVKHPDK